MISVDVEALTTKHPNLLGRIFAVATQPMELFENVGRQAAAGFVSIAPGNGIKAMMDAVSFGFIALMTEDEEQLINLSGFGIRMSNEKEGTNPYGRRRSVDVLSNDDLLGVYFMRGLVGGLLDLRPDDVDHAELEEELADFNAKLEAHMLATSAVEA